jgi:two-component system, sporulation sensor kinase E
MRKFVHAALKRLSKLDEAQIHTLIYDLASENELLEVVLDSMTDGVMVTDTDHLVTSINKSGERMLPLKTSEFHEKRAWEVIEDRDLAEFLRMSLVAEERIDEKELSFGSSGSTRTLSFSLMPMVRDGVIEGNILHIEDVTEKRQKEARLRRAESLASLTTLAAGVAHEIKNPLGSIGIHIQLIQKILRNPKEIDLDTLKKYLDIINEEIERLNGIVVDFLFAVRPMDTELQSENINEIIRETLDFVQFELSEAGVKLHEELDEALPNITLDKKYIKQALLNMIKNAVAAMNEGGILTIRTFQKDDSVQLEIEDTGHGIDKEEIDKIFEPYYTTKEFGSGLGLTNVYKIVKEHGGEITLNSVVGEGTVFTISLPLPQKELLLVGWRQDKEGNDDDL